MRKIYAFTLSCLMSIGVLSGQTFNWEEQVITDRNENLQSIALSDDGTATLLGYGNVFVQSTDGGNTWTNTGVFEATDDFDYQDISFFGDLGFAIGMTGYKVIDHPAGSSMDLLANSPLLKTTDGGQTWDIITVENMGDGTDNTLHPSAIGNHSVKFTALEVTDTNTVYVGVYWKDVDGATHQNVLKSTDAGTSWTVLLPDNGNNYFNALMKYNGNLYITGNKTLYKVSLTNDSVTNLYAVIDEDEDDAMYIWHPSISGTDLIFPTSSDSVWITSDEGTSFHTIPNIKKGYYVYKDGANIVVLSSSSDTKASADGGATWTSISANESLWKGMVIGDSLVALAKNEIYTMATADIATGTFAWNAKTITEVNGNLKGICTSGNNTYIAGFAGILLKSTDGAQTFSQMNIPSESDIIYASLDMDARGLSAGSGASAIASTRRIKIADFPSDGPDDKYRSGLLLSTSDNWANFHVIDDTKIGAKYSTSALNPYNNGCYAQDYYTVECVNDTTFYTFVQWYDTLGLESKATYGRVFKTTDGGENWDTITADLGKLFINAIVADGDDLFIGGSKTLLKSEDNGATLTSIADKLTALGATNPYIQDIVKYGDTLYIPTTSDSVFVSYDNGDTFSKIKGLAGANKFVAVDANSWMSLGSSTKCKYTNDAGTNWEGCYPGSTVFSSATYNNQIIALCKSKIYKLDIADLEADAVTGIKNNATISAINVWQSNAALHISSESIITGCNVYSISGKCVFQANNGSKNLDINTSDFIDGIYIVRTKTATQTLTHKVMIK